MMRGRHWKIGDRIFDLSRQGLIMGVLNVTPDSFSDGGKFFAVDNAVEHGLRKARTSSISAVNRHDPALRLSLRGNNCAV
jgi:Pterin binding enzyme